MGSCIAFNPKSCNSAASSSGAGFGVVRSRSPVKMEFAPARKHSRIASRDICLRLQPGGPSNAASGFGRRRLSAPWSMDRDPVPTPAARTFSAYQHIDRDALRMQVERGELVQKADAVVFSSPIPKFRRSRDAEPSTRQQSYQTFLVNPCADDVRVKLREKNQVMVVGGKAGLLELSGLRFRQHAQRAADFHAQHGHRAYRLQHQESGCGAFRLSPCGAMQKRVAPSAFARRAAGEISSQFISGSRSTPVSLRSLCGQ